ncbi:MAG: hypothetical protein HUU45_03875 [Leptospiraceae bacterium]|nr:hypothetical protein [Leptospiraceae bacterium]
METKLQDIVNVGIGALQTSKEVWEKMVNNLSKKKDSMQGAFEGFRKSGETNFSDNAVKLKVNLAWSLVRFDELKENIEKYFFEITKANQNSNPFK